MHVTEWRPFPADRRADLFPIGPEGPRVETYMTSSEDHDGAVLAGDDALDAVLQRAVGLTLDAVETLTTPDLLTVALLVEDLDGSDAALALLDALAGPQAKPTLLVQRIERLLDAGRYPEAVQAAHAALATHGDALSLRGLLVRALLNAGNIDEAAAAAAALLEAEPARVTSLQSAGLVALKRRDTAEARALFERLLALHPHSPTGLRGRARTAFVEGDAGAALDDALGALEHYPESAPADLLREIETYAGKILDATRRAHVVALVDGLRSARIEGWPARREALRARLQEEAARRSGVGPTRERSPRDEPTSARTPRPERTRDRAARPRRDDGDLPETEDAASLPPAPPPDPALHDALTAALHDAFGYDAFRVGQEETVQAVLAGHDVLAVMPTGGGKSLCYQLPAFLRDGVTLVISPLIALMKDQVESLPPALLAQTTFVNSSLDSAEMGLRLGEIAAGRYKLVYAAPERLRQRPFIHALVRAGVRLVVIDEAHCLSMWGHDFRPDYLFVRAALDDLGGTQVLGMTATATPAMMAEIAASLGRPLQTVNTGVLRDNLFLVVQEAADDDAKMHLLLPFVQQRPGCGIVYANSRDHVEKLERALMRAGVNARAFHAGMQPAERAALQDKFMSGEVRVMVATVAFGMGVDKGDVRFIVHYHPPRSLEAYSQESGRAGRDGKPATCVLLYTRGDRSMLKRWSGEQAVDRDGLRAAYRALRAAMPPLSPGEAETGLVDEMRLRESLAAVGQSDTDVRVALSLLERAGLLVRGPNVPHGATMTLASWAPPDKEEGTEEDALWVRLRDLAHLEEGRPTPVDLVARARDLGLDVAALEDALLRWQDDGLLAYRTVGRSMQITLVPPPSDVAARMDSILDALSERASRRLSVLSAYLTTTHCRHTFIARHFGHDLPEPCRRCDVCRPVELAPAPLLGGERIDDPLEAVKRLVAYAPLSYGKKGVVEILKGTLTRRMHADRVAGLYGSLAHLGKTAIERAVERLLAEGVIVSEAHDDFALLRPSSSPDTPL